jgi:hypothetical protein
LRIPVCRITFLRSSVVNFQKLFIQFQYQFFNPSRHQFSVL